MLTSYMSEVKAEFKSDSLGNKIIDSEYLGLEWTPGGHLVQPCAQYRATFEVRFTTAIMTMGPSLRKKDYLRGTGSI